MPQKLAVDLVAHWTVVGFVQRGRMLSALMISLGLFGPWVIRAQLEARCRVDALRRAWWCRGGDTAQVRSYTRNTIALAIVSECHRGEIGEVIVVCRLLTTYRLTSLERFVSLGKELRLGALRLGDLLHAYRLACAPLAICDIVLACKHHAGRLFLVGQLEEALQPSQRVLLRLGVHSCPILSCLARVTQRRSSVVGPRHRFHPEPLCPHVLVRIWWRPTHLVQLIGAPPKFGRPW
mmetsp:Transcript_54491/g.108192  ORF Transcript_54491/g.108192 Transcript_54491/m.108192 type:complete len:236 (+) Transcript_54491:121-828(+)